MACPTNFKISIEVNRTGGLDLSILDNNKYFSPVQASKILTTMHECILENEASENNKTYIKKSDVLMWLDTVCDRMAAQGLKSEFNKNFK